MSPPDHPRSSSSSRPRSPVSSLKRPLSSPAPTPSAIKRANSEDLMSSDHEGSIGASRLHIASTPTPTSDHGDDHDHDADSTLTAPPLDSAAPLSPLSDSDLPPAYDGAPPSDTGADHDDDAADADAQGEDDEHLPPSWDHAAVATSTASYNGIDPRNQLMMVEGDMRSPLEAGDQWYLVSGAWFRRWHTACSGVAATKGDDATLTPEQVGPIDNSDLVADDGASLRKPLTLGVDVEVVPVPAWRYLCDWYGCAGPEFEREVVATAGPGSESIEFYPPSFTFFLLLPSSSSSDSSPVSVPTLEHPPSVQLVSSTPFSSLLVAALEAFSLEPSRPCRLWRLPPASDATSTTSGPAFIFADKLAESGVELLAPDDTGLDATLTDALLADDETRLALEVQSEQREWAVDAEAVLAQLRAAEDDDARAPEAGDAQQLVLPGAGAAAASSSAAAAASASASNGAGGKKHHGLFAGGWSSGLHKGKTPGAPPAPPAPAASSSGAPKHGHHHGGGLMDKLTGALTRSKTAPAKGQRGLVGLQNLGNTCFMNSAIQCMSNTKELQEYFLSGVYHNELNRDNPLGMRGQVAEAFGQLIERLWHGSGSAVAPREFKQALARFAPQFSGYGQQDSQELLAFLLDGTHEDLNRIKVKPATEAPDWEGGGDKELVELAKTCWEQYRSRNDSVIVDLFQGQYRSTVVCPDCDKVSIKFDPFMYVTTNLPVTKKWVGTVYVIPLDSTRGVLSVDVEVAKSGTIKTLKQVVGQLVDLDPKCLVVVEEWKHKFYKDWTDDESVTDLNTPSDKILVYEVAMPYAQPRTRFNRAPPVPAYDSTAPVLVPLVHVTRSSASSSTSRYGIRSSGDDVGSPFILSLSADEATSSAAIYRAAARQYARVSKRGDELVQYVEEYLAELEAGEAVYEQDQAGAMDVEARSAPVAGAADADAPVATTSSLAPPPFEQQHDDLSSSSSSLLPPGASSTSYRPTTPATDMSDSFISAPTSIPSPSPSPSPAPGSAPTRRRAPLFSLEVTTHMANEGRIPLDSSIGHTETLDARVVRVEAAARREAARQQQQQRQQPEEDIDMFSPTASRDGPTDDDADASTSAPPVEPAPDAAAPEVEPPADVVIEARPLLATGHILVAHWDEEAYKHFLDGEAALWGATEQVVAPALAARRAQGRNAPKKVITLADCLGEFTKEERLGEDDMWYCGTCKEHKQATKKVELWKVPDVLVFALKRFSSSRYSRDKIDDLVDFPIDGLDLTEWVEGDKVEHRLADEMGDAAPSVTAPDSLTYDLYAVSNHFGGLGGGHYTAFAKNHENGRWYDFDDSRVSEISPERIKSSAAYLLFYRRRTARPIGGAKSRELVESAVASQQASAAASDAGTDDLLPVGPSPLSSSILGGGDQHVPGAFPSPPGSGAEPGSPKDLADFDDADAALNGESWVDRPVDFGDADPGVPSLAVDGAEEAMGPPPASPVVQDIRLEHAVEDLESIE
ncbi:hypothetical protein JCM9279_007576 [Rhodotorula babjevae]